MSYIDDISDLQKQMKNYMTGLNEGNLSDNDHSLMIEVAGNYYEAIKKNQGGNDLSDILNKIEAFMDAVIHVQSNVPAVQEAYKNFSESAEIMILEQEKTDVLQQIFQTDIQEMGIHDLKLKYMQDAIDLDLKLYGAISEITAEVVRTQHCRIINNKIWEGQELPDHSVETDRQKNVQHPEEEEVLKVFSNLMEQQGMKEQSQDFMKLLGYVSEMQMQLGTMTKELKDVKDQLAKAQVSIKAQSQEHQKELSNRVSGQIDQVSHVQAGVESQLKQVSALKVRLIDTAKQAIDAFKEKGREEMSRVLRRGITSVKTMFSDSRKQMMDVLAGYEKTASQIDGIGDELKQIGNSFANVGRLIAGKDIKEVNGEKPGIALTRVINMPVRKNIESLQNQIDRIDRVIDKLDTILVRLDTGRDSVKVTVKENVQEQKDEPVLEQEKEPIPEKEAEQFSGAKKSANESVGENVQEPKETSAPEEKKEESQKEEPAIETQEEASERDRANRAYQGIVYENSFENESKKVVLYRNSPKAILETLKHWNKGRNNDLKFKICYIRKLNPETGQYENSGRYDLLSGKDVTPVYLTLPHMKREQFLKVVSELKQNGARYNPEQKAFYVTRQDDLSKFAEYLPTPGMPAESISKNSQAKEDTASNASQALNLPHTGEKSIKAEGSSVLSKLHQNSAKLEAENKPVANVRTEKDLAIS